MKLCLAAIFCTTFSVSKSFAQTLSANLIVGKWVNYATKAENLRNRMSKDEVIVSAETLCNICPEINFKADFTASVGLQGSDASAAFRWSIKDNVIIIGEVQSEATANPLSSGAYSVEVTGTEKITLIDKKGVRYILTKI